MGAVSHVHRLRSLCLDMPSRRNLPEACSDTHMGYSKPLIFVCAGFGLAVKSHWGFDYKASYRPYDHP